MRIPISSGCIFPTMNRTNPCDIRALQREEEALALAAQTVREQQVSDLSWLMSHEQGRRFVARLLDMTGLETTSFTGNSTGFFNEGARYIGVTLLREVKAVAWPEYLAMLKEQRK